MTAFLTLTLNPALDLSTTTAHLEHTHKLRCGPMLRHPGGGGVNVARVLHRLDAEVQAWHLSGGVTGAYMGQLLAAEGVPLHALPIAGTTRENMSVVETRSGHEYRFVLPGPTVLAHEWLRCLEQLRTQAPRWLVASGSLPPGVPDDFYARLIEQSRAHGGQSRVVLDTQGPALVAALQAGVYLVKPSLRELRELTGAALSDAAQWRAAAHALVRSGQAEMVALSAGEHGAVLATQGGVWQANALPIAASNGTTGAGDCFLAALLWALERGEAPGEALRWGVAAGSASLLAPGSALAQQADITRLLAQVVPVQALSTDPAAP
ncbi:1-phosphofructokinase family hexose kinase [Simplicispira psychrophila]|uniref:1-phosphofructokinase family hexose kinase n=1 Tax=Simplicispira psychrophila TaxID=80882 RepID=UPI00047F08CF|nr:1-phosphofructokinase family hexose kinase [Simplicispira psychrophila]